MRRLLCMLLFALAGSSFSERVVVAQDGVLPFSCCHVTAR